MGPKQRPEGPRPKLTHPPIHLDGIQDFLDLVWVAQHRPPLKQCGDLALAEGVALNRQTTLDGADPVGLP